MSDVNMDILERLLAHNASTSRSSTLETARGASMTQILDWVYHASQRQGLKVIEPRVGTHGQAWVYAAKDLVTASMFLGQHHDFILASGFSNMPYICERFAGAFDRAKANATGSIYVFSGSSFQANRTGFDAELVSEITVIPLLEIPIENAKTHLLEFRDSGHLEVYFFPDRPNDYPSDDSDLIANALALVAVQGQSFLDWLEREFGNDLPHVIKAVREARA
jgi:hypothetical protein